MPQVFIFRCFPLLDLIYCGRKLRDDQTLDFYGIQSGSTVHVLRKSWPEPDQKPGEEEAAWVTTWISSGGVWCGSLVTEERLLLWFVSGRLIWGLQEELVAAFAWELPASNSSKIGVIFSC